MVRSTRGSFNVRSAPAARSTLPLHTLCPLSLRPSRSSPCELLSSRLPSRLSPILVSRSFSLSLYFPATPHPLEDKEGKERKEISEITPMGDTTYQLERYCRTDADTYVHRGTEMRTVSLSATHASPSLWRRTIVEKWVAQKQRVFGSESTLTTCATVKLTIARAVRYDVTRPIASASAIF